MERRISMTVRSRHISARSQQGRGSIARAPSISSSWSAAKGGKEQRSCSLSVASIDGRATRNEGAYGLSSRANEGTQMQRRVSVAVLVLHWGASEQQRRGRLSLIGEDGAKKRCVATLIDCA